jgi:acyl dehydratase
MPRLEPWTVGPVTRTDFVRYQGASGDMYRVHHDEEYAKSLGYPSVFSVGMFQAGELASGVARVFGPENLRRYRARFRAKVWPGDVLTCSGEVLREYEERGERRVDLELVCTRQTGEVAVQASATFVLPRGTDMAGATAAGSPGADGGETA